MDGYGNFTKKDGTTYEGFMKNNKYYGKGLLKEPNGSKYDGDFKNGIKEG